MLDGAQRAPHGPLDLPALGIDFYVFAGHKAYGPNGIGVLWAKAELLDAMPPFHGGGSMIGRVDLRRDDLGAAAAPLRGRHAADRSGDRAGRRLQVDARRSTGRQRTRTRWRWSSALMDGLQKIDGATLIRAGQHCRTAIRWCRSCSTASIRTTWRRPSIRSASRCAPAITAASR